ncbi:uncharacterized methyltransferase YodH-like [Mercenaria mercenaria]|uniref:uncharacterized methyltransferase YodH-like n=1 Tax=Mercenaria mercenaria TaxID=6596 RepID=UPI00234F8A72|nr:uncharacterized methyltransferase YodH-like [Mercenaria mercenaria]
MSLIHDYNQSCSFYDDQRTAVGSDIIAAMIQLNTGKQLKDLHVLDAGCGTGSYAKALFDIGVGYLTLMDASTGMLERARAKLSNYLAQGRVQDMVECRLPPIPVQDDCFDAVMFNSVLHHLDRTNSDFSNVIETLQESRRILRRKGVIVITTILPETFAEALWFMQIDRKVAQRFIENNALSLNQLYKIFEAAGICCTQKMTVLGSDLLNHYYNVEDPLEVSLRRILNEFWSFATVAEVSELVKRVKDLKDSEELEAWIKSHDRTSTMGILTIMICKPLYSQ